MITTGTYSPTAEDIIHSVEVDLVDRQMISEPIHVVQYDKQLPVLEVKLWKNVQPYSVPSGCEVNVRYEKPDGTVVYNNVLGLSSNRQTVYVQISQQMTMVYGKADAVIEIKTSSGKIAATATILFDIERNPVQEGAIESTSEFKALESYVADAENSANKAKTSETNAKTSETKAKTSETKAKTSETNAKTSEDAAKVSETNAKTSETNAKTSETKAKTYEDAAKVSETNAKTYADNAKSSEQAATGASLAAKTSETNAKASETNAKSSETKAKTSETNAKASETNADKYATEAESWAHGQTNTRVGEDEDNAKEWYEKAKRIAQGLGGSLLPIGTYQFEDLPSVNDPTIQPGFMYNISNAFVTTNDFEDGSGIYVPSGANVYLTASRKWDVLSGAFVSSVNGQTGNVVLTPDNIGALATTGGTVTGRTEFKLGTFAADIYGSSSGLGFIRICKIVINENYSDMPIEFSVVQRGGYFGRIYLAFLGLPNTDPGLNYFLKFGNIIVYIAKIATSTWAIYINKQGKTYNHITVTDLKLGIQSSSSIITWGEEEISSLPSDYIEASPIPWYGETLPIEKGGTNADTATKALDNIMDGARTPSDTYVIKDTDSFIWKHTSVSGSANRYVYSTAFSKLLAYIKSKLSTVAASGSYNDLSDQPSASDIGALPISGGTVVGRTLFNNGIAVIDIADASGTNFNYMLLCEFTITSKYADQPIVFSITQRSYIFGNIYVDFSSINGTDPNLYSFTKTGTVKAYIAKTETSKWRLYVKSGRYDSICISNLEKGLQDAGVLITWLPERTNTLPSGYVEASPLSWYGTAETISETLPISKGGTGKTSAAEAFNTLAQAVGTESTAYGFSDDDSILWRYTSGNGNTLQTKFIKLWNYILSKLTNVHQLGTIFSNSETISNIPIAIAVYSGKAPVTVPKGTYVITREVYRNGSIDLGYIAYRVGVGPQFGENIKSENVANSKVQYISIESYSKNTELSTYVITDYVQNTGYDLTVKTTAIKIG